MAKITVSAPGKLMLLGEHSVVYDRPCLVTAVDSRVHVQIKTTKVPTLTINAPEVEIKNYKRSITDFKPSKKLPRGVQFIEAVLQILYEKYKLNSGLSIRTRNGFSSKYGLGSSSAVSVCTAKGISELFNLKLSNQEIFEIAYQAVLEVQGVGSGFDVAAAIWGGTLYFETGGKVIEPLEIKKLPLIVVYSGVKADTATIVKKLAKMRTLKPNYVNSRFDLITKLVKKARDLIETKRWEELGELFNKNQKILHDLGVSTDILHKLCVTSILHGAEGAKLSGSGGGDCLIVMSANGHKHVIEQRLVEAGGTLVPVETGAKGVSIDEKSN
ncbi:mevalonate kinase [Candidatus Beckwithbacteria bacterium]|nr:mevalonate kinase [Candidatus Beckwithbacteria bacterium]